MASDKQEKSCNALHGLEKRLAELWVAANDEHTRFGACMGKALNHARLAGIALNEARKLLGGGRKWSKWRQEYFKGSKESSCLYMRVASDWNTPAIKRARQNGNEPKSLRAFFQLLREASGEADMIRDDLRKRVVARLTKLKPSRLKRFDENFDELWDELEAKLDKAKAKTT